jgi:hypothetical protein
MHQKKNSLCDVDTRMVRTVREKKSHTQSHRGHTPQVFN